MSGHRPIDRAARNCAANRARGYAEQPVPNDLAADYGAANATGDEAGRA